MSLPALPWIASLAVLAALLAGSPASARAGAVDDVATANGSGKPVFLVALDGPGPQADAARATAQAAQALAPGTTVVELDRRDPAQAASVARYRLAAAPLPLILVIASNGVATGAQRPGEGAAQRLVALIPSPRKADYMKLLADQKVALVVFTRATMAERSPVFEMLGQAVKSLAGKADFVLVDLDDKAETRFVADLKADPAATRPLIVVVNPKGQVLGRLDGAPTLEQVVTTAQKKQCCSDPNCKDCGK